MNESGRRPGSFAVTLASLIALLVLGGCGSNAEPPAPHEAASAEAEARRMVRPISGSDLPPGCSPPEVKRVFDGLLEGANSRDRARVARRIAAQPELVGFILGRDSRSPTGASGRRFRTPSGIYRYFAGQSSRGYRRHLVRATVGTINPGSRPGSGPFRRPAAGTTADDPVVAVGFTVEVTAEGGRLWTQSGKAGINCASGRFYFYGGG